MNNFKLVFSALLTNKLRFSETATRKKRVLTFVLIAFVYAAVMSVALVVTVSLARMLSSSSMPQMVYMMLLIGAAMIVLVFGVFNLVSVLYLSKDTDFYSALPVKSQVVFFAKLLYVYVSELFLVVALFLPIIIVFGAVSGLWVGYYFITIPTLLIVPALPLMIAAIFAIPIMYLAGKLKNRNGIVLVFYMLLFGGFFAGYFVLMFSFMDINFEELTPEKLESLLNVIRVIGYVLYPFTALSNAAFGVQMYGLSVGLSTFVNLLIFLAISVALLAITLLACRFMYDQAAKANNQTYQKLTKHGEYKALNVTGTLIKRELVNAMRSTQIAFQCFGANIILLMFPFILVYIVNLTFADLDKGSILLYDFSYMLLILPSVFSAVSTSFSREGISMASLKTMPVTAKQIVAAKVMLWAAIAVPVSIISVTIVSVYNFVSYLYIAILVYSLLFVIAGSVFSAIWDLRAPKLKWTDPIQAIKHNGNASGGMIMLMIGGFINLIATLALTSLGKTATAMIVFWSIAVAWLVVVAVVDILMYRRINTYYNRIEV